LFGGSVGTVNTTLNSELQPQDIKIVQQDGKALPFTLRNRTLHFFSGLPGVVRVTAADRELVYSLVLPEVAEARWEPPAGSKRGIPQGARSAASSIDLWQALACLGAAGLLIDWVYFGRLGRAAAPKVVVRAAISTTAPERWQGRLRRSLRLAGRGRR